METILLSGSSDEDLEKAAELLREGAVVAFPTETVYGLGARADREEAVERVYQVKQRPREKKAALLVTGLEAARRYAAPLSKAAERLARRFWPGPLTLVVPGREAADFVGLRCPDCEPTLRMLELADVPVIAPSANITDEPPAKTAQDVLDVFDGKIAGVLDGGRAELGVASTVVKISAAGLEILREGALPREEVVEAAMEEGE